MNTILLIEDNLEVRENICEILELEGYKVHVAQNGVEGIASALGNIPQLILCDIMMPGVSGYQVFAELKKNSQTAQIPFVFLSANVAKSEIEQGLNMGACAYISKPFKSQDLIDSVKSCLNEGISFNTL
jgi:CheY-like chemotaxis protein